MVCGSENDLAGLDSREVRVYEGESVEKDTRDRPSGLQILSG